MKQGVAAALDRLAGFQPDVKYAVVFDSTRWCPVQPPPGSEWDYEPFHLEQMAREAMTQLRPGESDPELWELRDGAWQEMS